MRLPAGLTRAIANMVEGVEVSPNIQASIFDPAPLAGAKVTQDSAMQLAAFWASVRYISSQMGIMPWGTYRSSASGGREELRNHRVWKLLHDGPAPTMSPFTFKQALVHQALVLGNGYAEIRKDGLELLDPAHMKVWRDKDRKVAYEYTDQYQSGEMRRVIPGDLIHIMGPSRDGIVGMSVLSAAREGISFAIAVQSFGAAFFGNGTHVGGIYQTEKTLSEDSYDRLKKDIAGNKGSGRAHRPRILEGGLTYVSDTIPPQDSQFLETRKFSAREIASLFGVPPHKIGLEDGATAYASREQAAIEAVVDCLLPWVVRLEHEANMKLLTPADRSSGVYTKLSVDAIMRGDAKSRGEFYQLMTRNGAMSPNECAAKEDLPAVEGGDERMITRDLIPLSRVGEYADSQIASNSPAPALDALKADASKRIGIRAKQNAERGRDEAATLQFAAEVVAPIAALSASLGIDFDTEAFITQSIGADDGLL